MVVIHIKKGELDQFLIEATCDTTNDELIARAVTVWNDRLRLGFLVAQLPELARYGPAKAPDKQGIDRFQAPDGGLREPPRVEELADGEGDDQPRGPYYEEDPQGLRTGEGVGPELTETFERVAAEAQAMLDIALVKRRVAMSVDMLQEKLDNIRGAVTMAFPMGLPEWDPVRLTIEGTDGLEGTPAGQAVLDPDTAELWLAGRQFERSQTIGDRLGNNEKTKVIAKLQAPGDGPPAREAAVSEEERKAMMAYYFKKQEELKRLAEAEDDEYLGSGWADPRLLQRQLRGTESVRAPGV